MNPIAIFFLIFFLGLISGATLGLEVALANPKVNVTFGDIFLVAFLPAVVSAVAEVPKVRLAVKQRPSDFGIGALGITVIIGFLWWLSSMG